MDTNFSRDALSFTLMERGLGSKGLRTVIAGCMALALFAGPSLVWAGDSHPNKNASRHHLIDHQRIQDLKERIADLRTRLKQPQPAGGGTSSGSLESLQAKVTSLESSVNALLSADATLLTALQARIATLESQPAGGGGGGIPDLEKYVSINPNPMNGVNGPHIIFKGVNVHVQSGTGSTADTTSGLGNLIIGYNETDPNVGLIRNGAHNLVGGQMNSFSSSGGVVFGLRNAIRGQYASVLGGERNVASGMNSTILGGGQNTVTGQYSTVLGGQLNAGPSGYSISPELQAGGS
jgi:hypothetical protein